MIGEARWRVFEDIEVGDYRGWWVWRMFDV